MTANHKLHSSASPLRLLKPILQAIRHHDFSFPEERLLLAILEHGCASGRAAALIGRQDNFATLDGKMDKAKVSVIVRRFIRKRVIDRGDGVYSFRPPAEWQYQLRTQEGLRQEQLTLEQWLQQRAEQLDLNLWELDQVLKEGFGGPVAPQTTLVVSQTTAPVAPQTTPVASQTTGSARHINVGSNEEVQRKRSTLSAVEAREAGDRRLDARDSRLEELRQFLADRDGEAAAAQELSSEGSLGLWRRLTEKAWAELETEMGQIKMLEGDGYKCTTTSARRLTNLMRESLGERWEKIFPRK